jgi:hypothetical protein
MSIVLGGLASGYLVTGGLGAGAGGSAAPPVALTLREAVHAWLVGQAPLAAIVGSRVYFGQPSQLAAYPCLVVLIPTRRYGHNLGGADGTSVATVEISGLAAREADCVAMAEAIRDFADGFQGTQSGVPILSCLLDEPAEEDPQPVRSPDGGDSWIYQITLDYRVKHRVPMPTSVAQSRI